MLGGNISRHVHMYMSTLDLPLNIVVVVEGKLFGYMAQLVVQGTGS